ncbi:MAG TPA: universal stress protein [Flavisolibacter sp.]|nr:universal stress protein [Flavisolibacter sp.]
MTVIVPTDFSAVANNAAKYAAQMLTGDYEANLILYHVYEKSSEAEEANTLLNKLKAELLNSGIVKIDTKAEESSDFVDCLSRLSRHMDAQLIVMGITGKSRLEKVFLGSNTLKMVEKNVCPVLVIPSTAQYSEIKNVALLSDFKDVEATIPIVPIKNVLNIFRPSLHILNVNSEHYVSLTEAFLEQRNKMLELFRENNPEFYFIGTFDLHDTVQQFVSDKHIDMLITIPRHHSFFGSMFKTTNTKKLVYESAIPILAAHE